MKRIIILLLIMSPFLVAQPAPIEDLPPVDELGYQWWASATEHGKDAYMLGYVTSTWLWSSIVWNVESHSSTWDPELSRFYLKMAPVADAVAHELSRRIDGYYADSSNRAIPLWFAIHEVYTSQDQFQSIRQGGTI